MYIQMEVYIIIYIYMESQYMLSQYTTLVLIPRTSTVLSVLLNSNRHHDLKWKNLKIFVNLYKRATLYV